jgi:hypothetical protein
MNEEIIDMAQQDDDAQPLDEWEDVQEGQGIIITDHLEIEDAGSGKSKKYGLTFNRYRITTHDLENVIKSERPNVIRQILSHVLDVMIKDVPEEDMVRICIEGRNLKFRIWTPMILKSQLTVDRWMDEVERILQSQEDFPLDEGFSVEVHTAKIPSGRCSYRVPALLARQLNDKSSVIQIKNNDDICMARALVVGKAHADGNRREKSRILNHSSYNQYQSKCARKLIRDAGLKERKYSLDDIPAFEAVSA